MSGCNCCKSGDKLNKLFTFLGLYICFKCKGTGRVKKENCCCDVEIITCPECGGDEFMVEEDSILKTLICKPEVNDTNTCNETK